MKEKSDSAEPEKIGHVKQVVDFGLLEWRPNEMYYLAGLPFTGFAIEGEEFGLRTLEIEFSAGKENGMTRSFFQDGRLSLECNYTDGFPNGIKREWYENGIIKRDTCYDMGEVTKIMEWSEDGVLQKDWADPHPRRSKTP